MNHTLLKPLGAWTEARKTFHPPLNVLDSTCVDVQARCEGNTTAAGTPVQLDRFTCNALSGILTDGICVLKLADGYYSAEYHRAEQAPVCAVYNIASGVLYAGSILPDGHALPLDSIIRKLPQKSLEDMTAVFAVLLFAACDRSPRMQQDLEEVRRWYRETGGVDTMYVYRLCDAVHHGLNEGEIPTVLSGSAIPNFPDGGAGLRLGAYSSGQVMCGTPEILSLSAEGSGAARPGRMGEAMEEYRFFREAQSWTAEEQALIVNRFPNDMPVPADVLNMARRYTATVSAARPIVNILWRGGTSVGKSTGVEMLAQILGLPLLRQTCHSTMETMDFLTQILPETRRQEPAVMLPALEEIIWDPETAYEKLTGRVQPGVSAQFCLETLIERCSSRADQPGYRMTEANYLLALEKGYLVEVQEASRIRDVGVLVGLNEMDRPGAVIRKADGTQARRHPRALVVFTDNTGYRSCHPMDPSVLRRFSYVVDTPDLSEEDTLARVKYNLDLEEDAVLHSLYRCFSAIRDFCRSREFTDGTCSATEFELWVQCAKLEGFTNEAIKRTCRECVISKCTAEAEEQEEILASVLEMML